MPLSLRPLSYQDLTHSGVDLSRCNLQEWLVVRTIKLKMPDISARERDYRAVFLVPVGILQNLVHALSQLVIVVVQNQSNLPHITTSQLEFPALPFERQTE